MLKKPEGNTQIFSMRRLVINRWILGYPVFRQSHIYLYYIYPLVICHIAIENGTFSSLIYLVKIVIFHSKLLVYQKVII